MKRFSLIAVAALAGVSLASIPSSADMPPLNNFCKQITELGHFDGKMGKCMSAFKAGPAKGCKRLKDLGLIANPPVLPPPIDFKNIGECVSYFKSA